jgi:hypothetical protein
MMSYDQFIKAHPELRDESEEAKLSAYQHYVDAVNMNMEEA